MQFWRFNWLSHHGIWAITSCSSYMVSVRVSSKLEEVAEILFAKYRMAPEEDRVHSQNTRKCNFIGKKKPQEFVWKCIEKHMKVDESKIRRPATKEDKYCFFMIAKPFADR